MTLDFNYSDVIIRTIYVYILERERDYKELCEAYNVCTNMVWRRLMRKEKERLQKILDRDIIIPKQRLIQQMGISYKTLKEYPEIIEVKRKEMYLKRAIK